MEYALGPFLLPIIYLFILVQAMQRRRHTKREPLPANRAQRDMSAKTAYAQLQVNLSACYICILGRASCNNTPEKLETLIACMLLVNYLFNT